MKLFGSDEHRSSYNPTRACAVCVPARLDEAERMASIVRPSIEQLRVFLAGRVAVEADGVVLDAGRFAGRQGRLVFAYLVAERGRAVPRDELAEALWGEAPPATWDKALTVIASKLRGGLTDAGVDGGTALTGAFGCYRLDLPEGTWVDVTVATDSVDAAEAALAAGELEEARKAGAGRGALVRQPFLPGRSRRLGRPEAPRAGRSPGPRTDGAPGTHACVSATPAEATKWADQVVALEPFREAGLPAADGGTRGRGQSGRGAPGSTNGAGGSWRRSLERIRLPRPARSTVSFWRRRGPC